MPLVQHRFKAMGGPCEISLWQSDERSSLPLLQVMEAEVRRLERKFSRFREDSLVCRLNRGELNGIGLDEETQGLMSFANHCYELSDGLFDLTIGALHRVWSFSGNQVPEEEAVQAALTKVGWPKLAWDGNAVNIRDSVAVDLGGLVKEFAVDRLVQILRDASVPGLVNLAGDIAASDVQPEQTPWTVAVCHPREPGAIAKVELKRGALATSGDYERYIETDTGRYCHLLRPDTGFPAQNGLCSVSVIAEQCIIAGSMSSIAMLKGESGLDWLQKVDLPYLAFDQALNASGTIKV
ncbi:FAD:protein FMN transferase [Reinekea blandensis]|uniref:FAD:protein FMN transferase n=1 Tax=Reinekea blandensis MED297 TaxID=314283 RepID=A4BFE7_9GAMM|nr:FAD:protein FMN transferase [Reinekea blandensis]EAR09042.1 thiamine biosynthesis lipoprotein ApbE, putative [Reinekea sp. MED297] [Reinekea blandensis MED297]